MKLRFKNFCYLFYYNISAFFSRTYKIKIEENLNLDGNIIVSLTTKPDRVHKTWMVIESILRQAVKPEAIFLYLACEEFKNESTLPKRLIKLKKRGLQIVFVEDNLKPHNKYFYAMSSFPKANVLTIDDDKIYPSHLIGTLKMHMQTHKDQICAVLARQITFDKAMPKKYICWDLTKVSLNPSHELLSLGVGGVLYPKAALHSDAFDKSILKSKALLADDIWIKIMALRNNTRVASVTSEFKKPFLSITGLGKDQLMQKNIHGGENDKVFNDLLSFYAIDINKFMNNTPQ